MTPRCPNRSASCPTAGPPTAAPAARKPAATPPAPTDPKVVETSTTVPIWVIETGRRARKAIGRKVRPANWGRTLYCANTLLIEEAFAVSAGALVRAAIRGAAVTGNSGLVGLGPVPPPAPQNPVLPSLYRPIVGLVQVGQSISRSTTGDSTHRQRADDHSGVQFFASRHSSHQPGAFDQFQRQRRLTLAGLDQQPAAGRQPVPRPCDQPALNAQAVDPPLPR